METIPNEIIKEFLKYLNLGDKYALLFVSKRFALFVGKQECERIMEKIIKYGTVNQLLWAEKMDYKYDKNEICETAALGGNLEILRYAHINEYPWDELTCTYAAKKGHLECLVYAHENECAWDWYTCSNAAENGKLECLKYAHENGCPWDEITCTSAAGQGHLNCLKYAYENGCSWSRNTCFDAALWGQLHTLQYCYDNGCPWDGYEKFLNENGIGIKLKIIKNKNV